MRLSSKPMPLSCMALVQTSRPQMPLHWALQQPALTRKIHSTRRPASAAPSLLPNGRGPQDVFLQSDNGRAAPSSGRATDSPLAKFPLGTLLRSLLVQHASSMPLLFRPSVAILSFLADAKSPLFSPAKNPVLRRLIRVCLYDMFCAGETGQQVARTTKDLRAWGVQGVILSWAREFVFKQGAQQATAQAATGADENFLGLQAIREWGAGNLRGVEIASPGDMVALKLSGAGPLVLQVLQDPRRKHEDLFLDYVHKICRLAKDKGVSLCVDAEQQRLQAGIDDFSMALSLRYNGSTPDATVINNTYQTYLRSSAKKLSEDLQVAAQKNICLGVKLVRGAYLTTEKREILWATKEETDAAFDGMTEGVMRRDWTAGGFLGGSGAFPQVNIVLATHNLSSVQKACAIRLSQIEAGQLPVKLTFAQLMGMADHVTAAAIKSTHEEAAQLEREALVSGNEDVIKNIESPAVFKYLAWGSVEECLKYLVRRAEENRDAATRTIESRKVLWEEVKRRFWRQA